MRQYLLSGTGLIQEVEMPRNVISFSLVELVQYIVPLYPTISGKVNPFSAVVSPL
ncbi:hypothetical protein GIB67_012743 [Kingdonia uniflora]|uniref:Uncharacterized protein n=1 Tax=Kingdonia uniflora TaxID=39325 RepID=A0A7J7NF79_9MAGN|nr:hypothetical protein GIB67_012743 [Kingdonia uniflora]